jgi:5-bromo-4-chloroindolyl phosphate hydrolysis protein
MPSEVHSKVGEAMTIREQLSVERQKQRGEELRRQLHSTRLKLERITRDLIELYGEDYEQDNA